MCLEIRGENFVFISQKIWPGGHIFYSSSTYLSDNMVREVSVEANNHLQLFSDQSNLKDLKDLIPLVM